MANHYKNSNKKPGRANGARYREEPKSTRGLRVITNKSAAKKYSGKPDPKNYSGGRYRTDEQKENSSPVILRFPEKKNEGEKTPLRFRQKKGSEKSQKKPFDPENLPTSAQLEKELKRERNKKDSNRLVRNTIFALITVAAAAILVATLFLPILQIYGTSMTPTLSEGDIVVSVKGASFERGDIISFYYNNKILVKRVIAFEGEYINIDDEGNVLVNNKIIDEPYLTEKAFGECDLKLPYQVPAGKLFVLGDHRSTSIDSRSSVMGCVSEEQIVGRISFRVWPFNRLGEVR